MAVDEAKVAELRNQLDEANKALNSAKQAYMTSPEFQVAMREQSERSMAIERAAASVPAIVELRAQMMALQQQMVALQKGKEEAVAKFVADNPQMGLVMPVVPQDLMEAAPMVVAALKTKNDVEAQLGAALKG